MGNKEKLLEKLYRSGNTFTFRDAAALFEALGYVLSDKGKTYGSRVMFTHQLHPPIILHRPHPQKELKAYVIRQPRDYIEQEGLK